MARVQTQIPLDLSHSPDHGRDSFILGSSNRESFRLIERWPDWPAQVVVLTGPPGSGKTHLANVWAARAHAMTLSPATIAEFGTSGRLPTGALLLEDVAGDAVPERDLFHLINASIEAATHVLITSRSPVSAWRISLPDLTSRLRLAAPARLLPPDDDLLRQVLVKLFADRQMTADKALVTYLLSRMERSFAAAAALVDALDRESLASASAITRPLAARVLARSPAVFADRQQPSS